MKNYRYKLLILILVVYCNNALAITDNTTEFKPTTAEVIEQLGWITDNTTVCNGYYNDPLAAFSTATLPDLTAAPITIDANQTTFHQAGTSTLQGNVVISQPGRSVRADTVELNRDAKTGDITTADLKGDVVLREPNKTLVSEKAHVELKTRAGNFLDALYRLLITNANPLSNTNASIPLNAWGKADSMQQKESGILQLQKTTFSTCAPTANTWQISANKIDLDRDEGRGVARDAWLYIKDVPVFYLPYLSFPIDNRRASGFLFPSMSSSSLSGFSFEVPYYWNIAPNYDAVITPRILTKRGLQLNGLFRYLTEASYGTVTAGFIPNDRAFTKFQNNSAITYSAVTTPALSGLLGSTNNRSLLSWQDMRTLAPRWTSGINYNYLSDDYYLQDFGGLSPLAQNQLARQANLNYLGDNWNFSGKLSDYQTLHLVNQVPVANLYQTLPELDLNGAFPNQAFGLNYQWNNQVVYFQRLRNPGETITPPSSFRFNTQPGVSLPLNWASGYVKPDVQLVATHYQVNNPYSGSGSVIQRTIPMADIDSGLYFDRHFRWFNQYYQQTLEPRLFYLYVPYSNQNNIPIFDSALIPFSYDSIFLTNRFSGLDRIGDANQVTFALTTRFVDDATGVEKFRASLGEIYYFSNRRVNLCSPNDIANAAPGSTCANPNSLVGITSPTERVSPLTGQLRYSMTANWNVTANAAWDTHIRESISGNLNLQYHPTTNRVFNINYNYLRFGDIITNTSPPTPPNSRLNDLNQGGFSFGWPIAERWAMVGGWNLNFARSYTQSYFYGLQYDSCCWSVRLVAGRTFNSLNQSGNPVFNNAVYLQWQLKGLGTVSTGDPSNLLLNNIPGYQDNFKAAISS